MMNTRGSDEWKSLYPISSVHAAPLLLSPTDLKKVGPLIFNPHDHHYHDHLFTSPFVSPQIPPPYPNLTLSRFLKTSSSILPSTTTSIASQLSSPTSVLNHPNHRLLAHNALQLMRCPGTNSTLAFFPTGSNSDQVGVLVLNVENSRLQVTELKRSFDNQHHHRILKISVNPRPDSQFDTDQGDSKIGYLLVCTTNSLYYYNIRIKREPSGKVTPRLELVGNKLFKSSLVIHACWSPHIPEEGLVLLENGDIFLFDVPSVSLIWKRYKLVWDDSIISEKVGWWLSCDFSYHPRYLIVVHSNAVFFVDLEENNIVPLLKLHGTNERFVAFSVAAHYRFHFTLASNRMVFLCDSRKPMIPLLRWAHNVADPSYVLVSSLSDLRSQSEDDTYSWASEAGYGIVLGSFWNCEFSLLCYGPDVEKGSDSSSIYAWGLPSDLSLVTNNCRCGSCLVKEEFSKDLLHNWINWQQKKEIVLGFGILDKEISSQLCKPDSFGGFTVISLTSSGNLESRRYCASWGYSENGHIEQVLDLEDSVLYEKGDEEYKFKKVFQYLKLDWLVDGYLKSDLTRNLSIELSKNHDNENPGKASFGTDFHEQLCQKLNAFSFTDGSLSIKDVFKDINLPMSIHEIALTSLWANLPKKVLRFGFCMYSDLPNTAPEKLKNVPLEFLEVPCQQGHLPPFFLRFPSSRSSKWSEKQKPSDSLVGPVLPIPFLMTLHKARMLRADIRSANSEIDLECDEVMRVMAKETNSQICKDNAVSLADDNDHDDVCQNSQPPFASYKPVSVTDESTFEDEKHSNLMFRVGTKDVEEVFDSRCCALKFNDAVTTSNFAPKEMKAYKLLKRQYSNFEKGFSIYQDYMTKSNIHTS